MLLYLVARYDKNHKVSYPYGSSEYWETVNWVSLTIAALGFDGFWSFISDEL